MNGNIYNLLSGYLGGGLNLGKNEVCMLCESNTIGVKSLGPYGIAF